jgi:outer membrane lipoprotein
MRHSASILVLAIALGGCATVPGQLAGENFSAITPQQAASQNADGQNVRWGGEIIQVEPRADTTCFEVLGRELYDDARPKRRDANQGRFIACVPGFYDPVEYTKGRDLTVTGSLHGSEKHKVGEFDYTFPHVNANQVYLWPKREPLERYHPWGPYYDPIWGPYWGNWGWSPPIVIVRPGPPHP